MFEQMPNVRIVDAVLQIAQNLFRAHGESPDRFVLTPIQPSSTSCADYVPLQHSVRLREEAAGEIQLSSIAHRRQSL